jgi:hypothetical protein
MFADYASIRDGLLETIESLFHESAKNRLKGLGELKDKITNQEFNMVIMGQFKRGKSTFINALLGHEIVPTAIVPLTSVVTILRYGEKAKGVVHYLNNNREEISLSDINNFVTEKGNPQNKRGVKCVEAFYPSDYLLCDCLHSQSDCSGCHRGCAPCCRGRLWGGDPGGGRSVHFIDRTPWRHRDYMVWRENSRPW